MRKMTGLSVEMTGLSVCCVSTTTAIPDRGPLSLNRDSQHSDLLLPV
jgi:hypothetical protein